MIVYRIVGGPDVDELVEVFNGVGSGGETPTAAVARNQRAAIFRIAKEDGNEQVVCLQVKSLGLQAELEELPLSGFLVNGFDIGEKARKFEGVYNPDLMSGRIAFKN